MYEVPGVFSFEHQENRILSELFCYGTLKDCTVELTAGQRRKLQQLTLISMARERTCISYLDLQTQLQLPESDVEPFLLEAMSDGAITGCLDAQCETLTVYSCGVRNVRPDQVQAAKIKIDDYLDRLSKTIATNTARLTPQEPSLGIKRRLEG